MFQTTNEFVVNGLDSGQIKRLNQFESRLQTDSDKRIFDDQVRDLILRYQKVPGYVEKVNWFLDHERNSKDQLFSQSKYEWEQLKEALSRFQDVHAPNRGHNPHYRKAVNDLKSVFQAMRLHMLVYSSDTDIISNLPKTDTHSGFTYIETGRKKKVDNMVGIYSKYCSSNKAAKECGSFNRPLLPGSRTQGSLPTDEEGNLIAEWKLKSRLISMVDLQVIIAEVQFAKPLQDSMAYWKGYAGGKDEMEQSAIIRTMRGMFNQCLSLDYSAYDQSLPAWLLKDVFSILREAFRYDQKFDEQLWNVVVHDFIHKFWLVPGGCVMADHGVPSGSMFTQIVDSVANHLMINTVMNIMGVQTYQCFVMGDDNIIYYNECDVKRLQEILQYMFGVRVNQDKSATFSRHEDPEFLSRYWRMDGKQWRQPQVLIAKLLFPERRREYTGTATPDLVVYSYILAYRAGMESWMDVERFLLDHKYGRADLLRAPTGTLSGYLEFTRRYGNGKIVAA